MLPSRAVLWKDRSLRFAMGASATVAGALFGIIRNKWLATHLEASGLGVLAQITSGQAWLGMLAGMGMSLPVARAVGASGGVGDEALARRTVWTALTLAGGAAIVVAAAGLIFAEPISAALLGTREHALLVRISMLGVAGIAYQGVFAGLFAGRSDLEANLTLALAGGLASVAVTVALVPRWGLAGGALGLAVLAPVGVAFAVFRRRRSYTRTFSPASKPLLDSKLARATLAVGAAALTMSLVDLGTMLAVRAHYLRVNGIAANGLLQAALALSQQVGALFSTYISSYAFGKVSALAGAGPTAETGVAEIRAYTRRHWTPLLALAALTVASAMVASAPLLHLLYSSRFDAARPLMAWALLGEFCRIGMNVWAVGALPIGGTRLWLPIALSTSVGLGVMYAGLASMGVGALSLPLAYVGAGAFSLCFGGIAMSRAGVTLGRREILVAAASVAALAALAWRVAR